jgi:MFS family permease
MGLFYGGALIGPALAPVVAGVLTEYARGPAGGWRSMQWTLAAMGVLSFVLTIIFLPETIHVKGIDKVIAERKRVAAKNGKEDATMDKPMKPKFVWVWLNPLRPLALLKYPNVLAIVSSFYSSFYFAR